ncbi:Carbamoyl-phosphate synthase L chain, ATP binding domain [Lampropedia hyalina DSM 16112]|jgi:glutathione synthase/RimK-type ligase-like ATP-grasp enzyme|uniref:Carbamoyl-phosphate synthase L chain, ATP binding domain n=1 Tax=Lampropedia hyalina DSM 16112 TaxID=1122156 RepID=A0A1M5ARX7_9BURK|nr:hypothetical protein [Lampropedia hyalina]SHF32682.1 Carbamoyl-phosphate synthase L chain, ATP binding domain [Lampropedia hyalina DSM 16112]
MILAIHERKGSFSDRWIEYCTEKRVPFKIVNCHQSNIIEQLSGCSILLWNWSQTYAEDMLVARGIIKSIESMGIAVFPNTETCWHFDDKVSQKYLMEALNIPHVPSHVFLDKNEALAWAANTAYPKVFKLRSGAGSTNVRLAKNYKNAEKFIEQAFGKGFPPVSRWAALGERWWQFKRDKTTKSFFNISRGIFRAFKRNETLKRLPIEKNYAYFQEFIPGNDSDIRVIIIGARAFGIKRMVRESDFRASGSGKIDYNPDSIPESCISLAFDVSKKMKSQSVALDFIFLDNKPLIVEMSYAFASLGYLPCKGYWDSSLKWHGGYFRGEDFMIQDILGQS